MNLESKHAEALISVLEDAQDVGMFHVVFELPMERELQPFDLDFFDTIGAALDHLERKEGYGYSLGNNPKPVYYRQVDQLIEEIKNANSLNQQEAMNRNNLQNLQDEMKKLGFSKKSIEETGQKMEKGLPEFTVYEQLKGNKGQVDVTAFFRQSGQSDNYYLNKYNVALDRSKPLEEGEKYYVVSPNPEMAGKNLHRSFEGVYDAIEFFKEQKGDSKLGVGKSPANISELAGIKEGKLDYVAKEFERTYHGQPQTQTIFVERGKGFTVEQSANMIEGRAVLRDDLLNLGGQPYAAWVKLDFDTPKDKYNNYMTNQYHTPTYGFVTKDALANYNIKELNDPKQEERLIRSLENGNRPLVTVMKDGQETKLFLETAPRYRQLNFFREDGKPEKREQFMKQPQQDNKLEVGKGKSQAKGQERGIAV